MRCKQVGALLHDLLIAPGLRRNAKPYETYQLEPADRGRPLDDKASGELTWRSADVSIGDEEAKAVHLPVVAD
jgi:hypothetical protein